MRKKHIFILIYLILFIPGTIITTNISAASSNDKQVFWGTVHDQIMAIDSYFSHSSGALSEQEHSPIINSMTNTLAATIMFTEYNKGGSEEIRNNALRIIDTSSKYFGEVYTSDSRGWVSYYDFSKGDNSYVRGKKFTHDQLLFILGLTNAYSNLEKDDANKPDFLALINETGDFIEEYFIEPDQKWIDSLFIYNTTLYTKNQFRLVEHICWTIWASLNIPSGFNSPISEESIIHLVDFLAENGTFNGAIYNILSPEGNESDNVLKLRTNALYGIINLYLYEKTLDSRFFSRGLKVFDFLVKNCWDKNFKGFFDQVDENGLLLVQGKSLIGNALACLLSSQLAKYFPENDTIISKYVLSYQFIENYHLSPSKLKYYISCDRDGDALELYTLESNLLRLWQRSESLHIIKGIYSSDVSIGDIIRVNLTLFNPHNLSYLIRVTGSEIEDFNQTSSATQVLLEIPLRKNAEVGHSSIDVEIQVLNKVIDKSVSIPIVIGSDRRLPQGLVYLIALGILGTIVLVARYPPKGLEDLFTRISSISLQQEEQTDTEPVEEKKEISPQSEE